VIEALIGLAEKDPDVCFLIADVDKEAAHRLAQYLKLDDLPQVEIMRQSECFSLWPNLFGTSINL
jgi:hypothetical protein